MKRNSSLYWLLWVMALLIIAISCKSRKNKETEALKKISIAPIHIHRYEKALFTLNKANFAQDVAKLIPEYSVFLGDTPPDKMGLAQLNDFLSDPSINELYVTVNEKFPNLLELETELAKSFAYYQFYFPKSTKPVVFTYVSGLDYELPIKMKDSAIIIALDMYLGADYPIYKSLGIPVFKTQWLHKGIITRDIMENVLFQKLPIKQTGDNLLDKMILQGKLLYAFDKIMPWLNDTAKIKYSSEQLFWCKKNEEKLWSFLVENKLLFQNNPVKTNKFLADGPFSADFGKNSPPRMGFYLGWQIVKKYMEENPAVTMESLFANTDSHAILSGSHYKPPKYSK